MSTSPGNVGNPRGADFESVDKDVYVDLGEPGQEIGGRRRWWRGEQGISDTMVAGFQWLDARAAAACPDSVGRWNAGSARGCAEHSWKPCPIDGIGVIEGGQRRVERVNNVTQGGEVRQPPYFLMGEGTAVTHGHDGFKELIPVFRSVRDTAEQPPDRPAGGLCLLIGETLGR